MQNKKAPIIIFSVIIAAIVFSPYTITKLTSYGEELLSGDSAYQEQEAQVALYQAQEEQALAELAKIDAQLNAKSEVVAGVESEPSAPAFDPAVAPGTIKAKLLLADTDKAPDFSVRLKFIAVGDKSFESKTNQNGKLEIELVSGRYYVEVIPADNTYRLQGDAPAFFLAANSEKDLGELYLVKK
jgi:hypothetical protein